MLADEHGQLAVEEHEADGDEWQQLQLQSAKSDVGAAGVEGRAAVHGERVDAQSSSLLLRGGESSAEYEMSAVKTGDG